MKRKRGRKQSIAQFFLELGVLKRMPRSGWSRAGIQNPETIADHSFRTAMIAWALAKILNADSEKVVKMGLLHDLEETRTGDLDMVMKKYHLNDKRAKAYSDVLKNSPFAVEALVLITELSTQKTLEAKIVKDADKLDLFLQSHEYGNVGFKEAEIWKRSAKTEVKLEISKQIIKEIEKGKLTWWYK